MITTTLSRPDLAAPEFARQWRDFARLCGASFFQDWTWVGCLASHRYPDPVLVEARQDGRRMALALFNRRADRPWGETLFLHESGAPEWDAVFTEHNGPLILGGSDLDGAALYVQVLNAVMIGGVTRRLALSGVRADTLAAASNVHGAVFEDVARSAPYVDLDRLTPDPSFIDTLSRNTRHQLRRSNRDYAELGDLVLSRAETVEAGLRDFAELVRLHEITWRGRGLSGAFARPEVRRFHHALISDGLPRGEVDVLRIGAGRAVVGYLMNFNHQGVVSAYQSGFNYEGAGPHMKPGLTSHYLAIEAARAGGARTYDFLAGPSRYKSSFANAERSLHWLSVAPLMHPFALKASARRVLRKIRSQPRCQSSNS